MQKTAYDMRISDSSSYVCSSDLITILGFAGDFAAPCAKPGTAEAKEKAMILDASTRLRRLNLGIGHLPDYEVRYRPSAARKARARSPTSLAAMPGLDRKSTRLNSSH